jgi:hypothetical protein
MINKNLYRGLVFALLLISLGAILDITSAVEQYLFSNSTFSLVKFLSFAVVNHPLVFLLVISMTAIFSLLKEVKNIVDVPLDEVEEKKIIRGYFFKTAYYLTLIFSIYLFFESILFYYDVNTSNYSDYGTGMIYFFHLVVITPLNIILVLLTFLFKKWQTIELRESSLFRKIIGSLIVFPSILGLCLFFCDFSLFYRNLNKTYYYTI